MKKQIYIDTNRWITRGAYNWNKVAVNTLNCKPPSSL